MSSIDDLIGLDDYQTDTAIDEPMTYQEARTKREIAEAALAEVKLMERERELVKLELVNKLIFDRSRQFRDGLMGVARKTAPLVSAKTDIKEIEQILTQEFRHILQEFGRLPLVK